MFILWHTAALRLLEILIVLRVAPLIGHPCTKELESACPMVDAKDAAACLADREKHERPTKVSNSCLEFMALNTACHEEIKDYCDNDFYSDDTARCVHKWMNKPGAITQTFFSQQCRKLYKWMEPRLSIKGVEDTGVYTAGDNCKSREPQVGDKVVAQGAQSASLSDLEGNDKAWTLAAGEAGEVIEIDEDFNFRLKKANDEESGWAFREDFYYGVKQANVEEDPDLADEEKKAQDGSDNPEEAAKASQAAKMAAQEPEMFMQMMEDRLIEEKQKAEVRKVERKRAAALEREQRKKAQKAQKEQDDKDAALKADRDGKDKAKRSKEKSKQTLVAGLSFLFVVAICGIGYYLLVVCAPIATTTATKKVKKDKKNK